jgi:hypothetical protein
LQEQSNAWPSDQRYIFDPKGLSNATPACKRPLSNITFSRIRRFDLFLIQPLVTLSQQQRSSTYQLSFQQHEHRPPNARYTSTLAVAETPTPASFRKARRKTLSGPRFASTVGQGSYCGMHWRIRRYIHVSALCTRWNQCCQYRPT